MSKTQRERDLDAIWVKTHPDYKGELNGRRSILIYRQGTCLVYLDDLTDDEIDDRLKRKK